MTGYIFAWRFRSLSIIHELSESFAWGANLIISFTLLAGQVTGNFFVETVHKILFFFFSPVLLQVVQGIRKNKKLLFCLRILLLDKVLIYSLFLYKIPLERGNNVESLAGCFYLLTFCFLIYTDIKCEGLIFDCHIVF